MPSAEIITIGTEILLGEIQDTNTAYLARQLMTRGVDLYRTHTIGDNASRIAQSIKDSLKRTDIVITTGGLGPTVDDVTREAVALAVGHPLIFLPDLWEEICMYYQRISKQPSENNKRQAHIPESAEVIHNPIGTAPGFHIQSDNSIIICVPGVPKEMEYFTQSFILPYIDKHFLDHKVILSRTIHVSGMGESQVDMIIGNFEKMLNPTVGLLAKPGQIDIRVAAKAETTSEAENMITNVVDQLLLLLKDHVFGCDDDTLISSLQKIIDPTSTIDVIESGLEGQITRSLNIIPGFVSHSEIKEESQLSKELHKKLIARSMEWNSQQLVGCEFSQVEGISFLQCRIFENGSILNYDRKFAGPPDNGKQWAVNNVIDIIRRHFLKRKEKETL